MKPMAERLAAACEHAAKKRCRCRCAGILHGARRVDDVFVLPRRDPHAPAPRQITLLEQLA